MLLQQSLLLFDGVLKFRNLGLLLLNGVDQNCGDLSVLYALDFAPLIACSQKGFDLFDLFGAEANIAQAAILPIENNGAQLPHNVQAAIERLHQRFVAK